MENINWDIIDIFVNFWFYFFLILLLFSITYKFIFKRFKNALGINKSVYDD